MLLDIEKGREIQREEEEEEKKEEEKEKEKKKKERNTYWLTHVHVPTGD